MVWVGPALDSNLVRVRRFSAAALKVFRALQVQPYFRGGVEFYIIFALLDAQDQVATSASILPRGDEVATSASILPWGSNSI